MSYKYKNITVGSDPEVFLQDTYGKPIPAVGLLGGDKDKPNNITDQHSVQEDNVMAEFNIPPVTTASTFVRELNFCLNEIEKITGHDVLIQPSVEFLPEQLKSKKAAEFGCSSDNNVWLDGAPNPPIDPPKTWRYAGGHIHVGWSDFDMESSHNLIKAMDMYLGMPAMLIDTDKKRRETYGTPGRFRYTEFGVEYRTLSNFWLQSDDHMKWAFESLMDAINFLNNGGDVEDRVFDLMYDDDKVQIRSFLAEKGITSYETILTPEGEPAILTI